MTSPSPREKQPVPWGLYALALVIPPGGLLFAGMLWTAPGTLSKEAPERDRPIAMRCLILAAFGAVAWYAAVEIISARR